MVLTYKKRFWKYVHRKTADDCWLWEGAINNEGYGILSPGSTLIKPQTHHRAHRVSYEIHKGKIPFGLVIHHTCHVRHCVNPSHLKAIYAEENAKLKKKYIPIERKKKPIRDKFFKKVDTKSKNGCWLWLGAKHWNGYGTLWSPNGFNLRTKTVSAHRFSYILHKGSIPEGLHIDHLCRSRLCVNPDHLEAVTNQENIRRGFGIGAVNRRKTHCKRGHSFDEKNTYLTKNQRRACRACVQEYGKNAWFLKKLKESKHDQENDWFLSAVA